MANTHSYTSSEFSRNRANREGVALRYRRLYDGENLIDKAVWAIHQQDNQQRADAAAKAVMTSVQSRNQQAEKPAAPPEIKREISNNVQQNVVPTVAPEIKVSYSQPQVTADGSLESIRQSVAESFNPENTNLAGGEA